MIKTDETLWRVCLFLTLALSLHAICLTLPKSWFLKSLSYSLETDPLIQTLELKTRPQQTNASHASSNTSMTAIPLTTQSETLKLLHEVPVTPFEAPSTPSDAPVSQSEAPVAQFKEKSLQEASGRTTLSDDKSLLKNPSRPKDQPQIAVKSPPKHPLVPLLTPEPFKVSGSSHNSDTDSHDKKRGLAFEDRKILKERSQDSSNTPNQSINSDIAQTTPLHTQGLPNSPQPSLNDWLGKVIQHLKTHQTYPARAHARQQSGQVKYRVQIDSNGRVTQLQLHQGSGYALLDDAAQHLIQVAQPLPSPPEALMMHQKTIQMILPIDYRLSVSKSGHD